MKRTAKEIRQAIRRATYWYTRYNELYDVSKLLAGKVRKRYFSM